MYTMSYAAFPLIRLAVRSTPSPVWEKAFIVVLFLAAKPRCGMTVTSKRLLLKEKPFGECTLQLLPSVALDFRTQSRPRGTPMKSAQDVRSTAEGEIFK